MICIIAAVVGLIFAAGLLGGSINCLQARKADEVIPKHPGYYILLSVAAAFSVPLFLSLTKSELLKNVLSSDPLKSEDWFILFAVCLVASIYAQSFLETVSKKLLQKVEQVERTAVHADKVANEAKEEVGEATATLNKNEQASEKLVDQLEAAGDSKSQNVDVATLDIGRYDTDHRKVLEALMNPQYDRRTLGGIAVETGIRRQTLRAILQRLMQNGVVREVEGYQSGTTYYQVDRSTL